MNQILHFNSSPNRRCWFSSDLHWNHSPKWAIPIWESRGYKSVNHSNTEITNSINSLVKPVDDLFLLGDIALNITEEQFESFIGSIVCDNIYILWGNHNSRVKDIYHRQMDLVNKLTNVESITKTHNCEIYPFKYKNLIFIGNYAEIVVNQQHIVLQHYPIYSWNGMGHDTWHLYGHVHSKNETVRGKSLDIGWDAFKKPVSFEEIKVIMDSRPRFTEGHH
jgi:calcineurin-like phosphoesterase family protein